MWAKGETARGKIAVVEDNAAVRQELWLIAQYAQESGQLLEVTPFADGSQIVEHLPPRV